MLPSKLGNKQAVLLLGLAAIFAYSALLATRGVYAVEVSLFRFFNQMPASLYPLFWVLSLTGTLVAVAAAMLYFAMRRKTTLVYLVFLAGVGAYIVASLLKLLAFRARPNELIDGVIVRENTWGTYGFPSSHAAVIGALAAVLFVYSPAKWRIPIVIIAGGGIVSRMYLGVHLPLDLIGGLAIGAICFCVSAWLLKTKKP